MGYALSNATRRDGPAVLTDVKGGCWDWLSRLLSLEKGMWVCMGDDAFCRRQLAVLPADETYARDGRWLH